MFYRVFVQARMSSHRFPGKMLSVVAGRALVDWVLERVSLAVDPDRIVLATSDHISDDALAEHVGRAGYQVFRGDLNNVASRFRACLIRYPANWIVRICGDSPLLDPGLILGLSHLCNPDLDVVTNAQKRTFPAGQSVEFINARTFEKIDTAALAPEEQEHLTQVFYRHPDRYRIRNVVGTDPSWPKRSYVVDNKVDLDTLEPLLRAGRFPLYASALTSLVL